MSDNDLIRRKDALAAVQGFEYGWHAEDVIAALPAVKVRVKPLVWRDEFMRWSGNSFTSTAVGAGHTYIIAASLDDPEAENVIAAKKAAAQADYEARILAALEPVAAPDPALRPTMTDMMVDPDTLGDFMDANPLPPDPAAIRILALIQKGGDAYAVDPRHAPHEASPGVTAGADAAAIREAALREAAALCFKNADGITEAVSAFPQIKKRRVLLQRAEQSKVDAAAILALIQKGDDHDR